MPEREVRYCTSADGTRIAYCLQGEGPVLVALPQFVDSFSLDHLHSTRTPFFDALARNRTLVRYDLRGTGLSQRPATDFSLDAVTADLAAVVASLSAPGVSLFAFTNGGPAAIKFAAENPDVVRSLILFATYARYRDAFPIDMVRGLSAMARANWPLAARTLGDLGRAREELADSGLSLGKIFEQSTDGAVAATYAEENFELDARPFLGQVRPRSLLVYRPDDGVIPLSVGRAMAAAIPNARFVTLPGRTHSPYTGDWERVVRAVVDFLNEDPTTRAIAKEPAIAQPDFRFRTVLFTDLVGHTEMMSRLGDERGRAVLREHETIIRNALKQNGGTELKTAGDGFMASFGSVTRAIECAIAFQRAFAERRGEPLSVRVGLNAGEPIEEEGDLFGATVILASRIAAQAEGGEILVADTVRGLCSGKGFLFADRGEFVAKGFEEPVRVYEVRWRDDS